MKDDRHIKLYSLQYLRAIAAVGVVLAHASASLAGRDGARLLFDAGTYGVDLFFVISGFVMFYSTADRPTTPGYFFLRRCVRIIPPYFLLTTFGFLLAVFAPKLVNLFSSSPVDYLKSILFIPYYNRFYHDIRPEISQGWTMNYEMFFYFVFACCLWLKEQYRLWACLAVFAILAMIGIVTMPSGVYAKTYTNPIMLEFVFGVVIGYFLLRRQAQFAALVLFQVALGVAGIVSVFFLGASQRVLFAGLASAAIVSGALLLERNDRMPHWPFLLFLGDASYSLYLIHTFVLALLKRVFVRLSDPLAMMPQLLYMICGLVLAIAVAAVFYTRVERRMTRFLQAPLKRDRSR